MKVKVVGHKGETSLVEWEDKELHRVYIPSNMILDGEVSSDTLAEGIPYGLDFSRVPRVTPGQLEDRLHRAGIWTEADIRSKPNEVVAVLEATRLTLAAFTAAVLGGKR